MTTTLDETRARDLREALVHQLVDKGAIRSDVWQRVFSVVPRHHFVDEVFRRVQTERQTIYETDSDWLLRVYEDDALVTQLDSTGSRATSSSTTPSLMASMLEALDIRDGDRVLEIGTGTGYNAALLCERLGSDRVTSVDIYPELIQVARDRLLSLKFHPTLVAGDGYKGYSARSPYDRIIATCAVRRIPSAWLEQANPEGLVVTNVHGDHGSATVRLRVSSDQSATGRFLPENASFIGMESENQPARPSLRGLSRHWIDGGGPSRKTLIPQEVTDRDPRFWFLAQHFLPHIGIFSASGNPCCLVDYRDYSWARTEEVGDDVTVAQGGPQRLWDLLEEAYELWLVSEMPSWERYGMTVCSDGRQFVWLDRPDSKHSWELVD